MYEIFITTFFFPLKRFSKNHQMSEALFTSSLKLQTNSGSGYYKSEYWLKVCYLATTWKPCPWKLELMSLNQTLNQSYTEMGVIGLGRLEEEYGNDCKHDAHVSNCAVSIGMVISSVISTHSWCDSHATQQKLWLTDKQLWTFSVCLQSKEMSRILLKSPL